jgi:hypothetical protein
MVRQPGSQVSHIYSGFLWSLGRAWRIKLTRLSLGNSLGEVPCFLLNWKPSNWELGSSSKVKSALAEVSSFSPGKKLCRITTTRIIDHDRFQNFPSTMDSCSEHRLEIPSRGALLAGKFSVGSRRPGSTYEGADINVWHGALQVSSLPITRSWGPQRRSNRRLSCFFRLSTLVSGSFEVWQVRDVL